MTFLLGVGLAVACVGSGGSGAKNDGSGGVGGGGPGPGTTVNSGGRGGGGGRPSATGGSASGGGGTSVPCVDTTPPGNSTDCATWKSWGQCGSQWFREARLCDITCGVCATGPSGGVPGGAGGISSGGSKGTSATGGNGGTTVPKTSTPFVPPPDAKPTPESSGTSGAFRVNAQGHLTYNGTEFQVRGGNWFGLEGQDDLARPGAMELYIGSVYWATSGKRTIEQTMKEIAAAPLTLNTVRFPVAPQTLVANHPDGLY
jgi:hypothetical protein